MGAATKSSSAESRRPTAGRNLPPGAWEKSIRIRTTSPVRSVMDQQFIDRVIVSIGRLELPSASRAPGSVVFGDAPLEYDLNLLPRRNLRCDLRRNGDLAVRREFAPEVSGLHVRSLVPYIISRVRTPGRGRPSELAVLADPSGPVFPAVQERAGTGRRVSQREHAVVAGRRAMAIRGWRPSDRASECAPGSHRRRFPTPTGGSDRR